MMDGFGGNGWGMGSGMGWVWTIGILILIGVVWLIAKSTNRNNGSK